MYFCRLRRFVTLVAEVAHQVPFLEHVLVVGDEQAPFAAAEVLQVVQAEGSGHAQRAAHPALVDRAVRLAGVFDDVQSMLAGDLQNRIHVGRAALDVHRDDGFGPRR